MKQLQLLFFAITLTVPSSFIPEYGFSKNKSRQLKDIIINARFIDNHTFLIVCKGYPMQGLRGNIRLISAQDAALFSAELLAKKIFNSRVHPGRDGTITTVSKYQDHVVIHFLITKPNLLFLRK